MATNSKKITRRHIFSPGEIAAMRKAGCKTGAENMEKGRAPSGRDIRSLALFDPGLATKINKQIQGDGVEETEFAGV